MKVLKIARTGFKVRNGMHLLSNERLPLRTIYSRRITGIAIAGLIHYTRADLRDYICRWCMAPKPLKKLIQREAYYLVIWQLAGVACLTLLAWAVRGETSGFSVFVGGLAYGLPNLFFVWRVFRYAGSEQMTRFVAAFYIGEMVKMALSGILFLMIVKYLPVSLLSVLFGFIGAIVSFWVVCLLHFSKQPATKQSS